MKPEVTGPSSGFDGFVRTIAFLRGPDGCPWDKAQTHASLRPNIIEEAYETVAAIDAEDDAHLAEELGDVLLQVVLHAQIGADDGAFTIDDVVDGIETKIRRRHPHVFGDAEAATPDEVSHQWDRVKTSEHDRASVLDGVATTLPALMYAQKLSRRAVSVGFEWESLDGVWAKVHEEIDELKAVEPGSREAADEIGDLLFTVVNLARKQGIDAEQSLRLACDRFGARFRDMEGAARSDGVSLEGMGIEQMEALWQAAKERTRAMPPASEGDRVDR